MSQRKGQKKGERKQAKVAGALVEAEPEHVRNIGQQMQAAEFVAARHVGKEAKLRAHHEDHKR